MKRDEKETDNHYFASTLRFGVKRLPKGAKLGRFESIDGVIDPVLLGYYATRREAEEAISTEKENRRTKFRTKF